MLSGAEWVKDFDTTGKGIGFGGDQIAPLVGLAMVKKPGWVFIPLIQHFVSYSGENINQTALRLIAIQTLPKKAWVKYDIKVPIDWENETTPAGITAIRPSAEASAPS